MAQFDSSHDYWAFASFVKTKARYILDAKSQQFVDALLETSQKRKIQLPEGSVRWRAQLGHGVRIHRIDDEKGGEIDLVETPEPLDPKLMVPLSDRAYEGRVNAKGIPCLYLSEDRETAMAEKRPWIGSYVSVSQFVVLRDLNLVDCSSDNQRPKIYFLAEGKQPSAEQREQDVWWYVNQAFSEPVTRADNVADYAPTQVLAEAFRNVGFDGIVYGSKLGSGRTLAIFDINAAELATRHLFRVEEIKTIFSDQGPSYIVEKYADKANASN